MVGQSDREIEEPKLHLEETQRRSHSYLSVYFVPVVVFNAGLLWLTSQAAIGSWPSGLSDGWGFGQFVILMIWSGLTGRTWITGWLVCCLYVFCWIAISQSFFQPDSRYALSEVVVQFSLMQAGILSAYLPLSIMRAVRGWRLARPDAPRPVQTPISLEDWFWLSVVLCSSLGLTQIAAARSPDDSPTDSLGAVLSLALIMLLVVLPLIVLTFREQSRQRLWINLVIANLVWLALSTIPLLTDGSFRTSSILNVLLFTGAFNLAYVAGAFVVLRTGLRLVRAQDARRVVDDGGREAQARAETRHARLAAGLVGLGALGALSLHQLDEQWERQFYRRIQNPADYYGAAVQCVDLEGRQIVGVVMADTATDADLQRVAYVSPGIQRLKISRRADDETLRLLRHFPKLNELDLSHTQVKGYGLTYVPNQIKRLSLAHTRVNFARVPNMIRRQSLARLDISSIGLTDQQLQLLEETKLVLVQLNLSGNPLTDAGITNLLAHSGLIVNLNLSDTQVDGSCLDGPNCPHFVALDGTRIDDAQLTKLLAIPGWNCGGLSLKRTQITAALLPALTSSRRSLGFGGGAITEQDLIDLPGGTFEQLHLNGPEFTGECLTTGRLVGSLVDLSNSSVTDNIIERLDVQGMLHSINVSNTMVTEKGIQQLNVIEVDARNARLNMDELVNEQTLSKRIIVRHEELTPEQLVKRKRSGVVVDEESFSLR